MFTIVTCILIMSVLGQIKILYFFFDYCLRFVNVVLCRDLIRNKEIFSCSYVISQDIPTAAMCVALNNNTAVGVSTSNPHETADTR